MCICMRVCETIHMKMCFPYKFIFMQIKLIFIRKVLYGDSFWKKGTRYICNGGWVVATLLIFLFNISIRFFHDTVTCEAVKNCSNHGICAGPNLCTCERGFHGADCSEGIWMEYLTNRIRWCMTPKRILHTIDLEKKLLVDTRAERECVQQFF